MSDPRKRPGRLWMMFYGRQRRGVPWLLLGVLLAVLVFALVFAIPGGADTSRVVGVVFLGLLLGGLGAAIIVAAFFPRRRGR